MKKLTRKLFISILSMAFAVIAIGTTTFAWITISTTAEVKEFSANVEAGAGGIELSWDYGKEGVTNPTWVTSLDDVMSNLSNGFVASKGFSDICYANTVGNNKDFYDITVSNNTATKDVTGIANKYVEFSFYIRNSNYVQDNDNKMDVKVTGVSFTTTSGDSGDFTLDVPVGSLTAGQTKGGLLVSNAARMMIFVDEGTGAETPIIYEQHNTDNSNTLYNEINVSTGFAHAYFTAKGNNFGTLTPSNYVPLKAGETSSTLCTVAGTPLKITVRVWIEGWDNECHANILSQSLKVTLGFVASAAQ